MMRLARFLAQAGLASRRKADDLIRRGDVSVNGTVTKNVAMTVDPIRDSVSVKGAAVRPQNHVYYMLHKPVGYVCSLKDAHNPDLVTSLVPPSPRVFPVGRLDKDSTGLLLLTNDGDLANSIMHPRFAVQKIYEAVLDRPIQNDVLRKIKKGIRLEEGVAVADTVTVISPRSLRISIHQGWKRQIRRMLNACGYTVVSLCRISEGTLKLGKLKVGAYRILKKEDIMP